MSKTPIHSEDGSSLRKEPIKERPFTHPMEAYKLPPGVDKDSKEDRESIQGPLADRMAMIEDIAAKADADREIPEDGQQEGLPYEGQPETEEENKGTSAEPDSAGADGLDSEGLASKELMHDPEPEGDPLPQEYADDPLAEFIVMDGDEPMFRTKVNGEERLIPLEQARTQVQKQESADIRLQQATEWQKNLQLREEQIAKQEANLAQTLQKMHNVDTPPPRSGAEIDDETLEKEAREVVSGFFTGSEDEAAAKLADLMRKTRAPVAATPVNPDEIAEKAVEAARNQLTKEARDKDTNAGFAKFSESYPEIMADETLFRFADSMTDTIAAEHPDWMPSEVMMEAGKQVREWLESQKSPEQPDQPKSNDRRERKRQLRPIPRARQGQEEKEPEVKPETPADIMAEIRHSRGQVA